MVLLSSTAGGASGGGGSSAMGGSGGTTTGGSAGSGGMPAGGSAGQGATDIGGSAGAVSYAGTAGTAGTSGAAGAASSGGAAGGAAAGTSSTAGHGGAGGFSGAAGSPGAGGGAAGGDSGAGGGGQAGALAISTVCSDAVANWHFEEPGDTAFDSAGAFPTHARGTTPVPVPGVLGSVVAFDGASRMLVTDYLVSVSGPYTYVFDLTAPCPDTGSTSGVPFSLAEVSEVSFMTDYATASSLSFVVIRVELVAE